MMDQRPFRGQRRPILPGRAGKEWKITRRWGEWRERCARLAAGTGSDSSLLALGEYVFERIVRELLSLDEDAPVHLHACHVRNLLPLALACRAHCAFFRRFIVGLKFSGNMPAPRLYGLPYGSLVDALIGLPRLSTVSLTGPLERPARTLVAIARMVHGLVHIAITRCPDVSSEVLRPLMGCKMLEAVRITLCPAMCDDAAEYLACLPNLRELRVKFCLGISDVFAGRVAHAPQLQLLEFKGCGGIGNIGVGAMAASESAIHNLKFLSLTTNRKITDAGVAHIARGLPNLEHLCLEYAECISNEAVAALAEGCCVDNLQSLRLTGCYLTLGVEESIAMFKGLRDLSVSGIGDEAITRICGSCRMLSSVGLWNCESLSNDGVRKVVRLPRLQNLTLRRCPLISDALATVVMGAANLPLMKLDISTCQNVSREACSSLKALCEVVVTSYHRGVRSGPEAIAVGA